MSVSTIRFLSSSLELPRNTRDLAGRLVHLQSTVWRLNDPTRDVNINWTRYDSCDPFLVRTLRYYIYNLVKHNAPGSALAASLAVGDYLLAAARFCIEADALNPSTLSKYRTQMQSVGREPLFNHIRRWYYFCTDQGVQGFEDGTYAFLKAQEISTAAGRGVAVLSQDPFDGPLTTIEQNILRLALERDIGPIEERLVAWLALALGLNPANISLLLENDLEKKEFVGLPPVYFLNVPRIKKRLPPRAEFTKRHIDVRLGTLIEQLINANSAIDVAHEFSRPLFMRRSPRKRSLSTDLRSYAYHVYSDEITALLQGLGTRLGVVSPRTGDVLQLNMRRMRYTFARNMVRQGATPAELAKLLDHSDLQSVIIYYTDPEFADRLDATLAEHFGPLIKSFMGAIVDRNSSHDKERITFRQLPSIGLCDAGFICGQSVPNSCYPCDKFRPFSDGPHVQVLESLVEDRAELLADGNERVASQLDSLIVTVGEVVALTRQASP